VAGIAASAGMIGRPNLDGRKLHLRRFPDEVPADYVPTKNDERYLWLSFMTSGEYADQACIADEYTASEFEAQQQPRW
jgi:hypothetical protein